MELKKEDLLSHFKTLKEHSENLLNTIKSFNDYVEKRAEEVSDAAAEKEFEDLVENDEELSQLYEEVQDISEKLSEFI